MLTEDLRDLLGRVARGERSIEDAINELARIPVDDIGIAQIDTHRPLRQGFPEAIYAESKKPEHVRAIARRMMETTTAPVIATRVTESLASELVAEWPQASYNADARIVTLRAAALTDLGAVAVVCAGTSDLPVAEEAAETAAALGATVSRLNDAGIAGIHRLLAHQDLLRSSEVVIAVAGMEGALPTLIGGLTPAPIVAVPTSVGYGASFDGLAALLTMLNSCAAGVVVVNIDNGFGAAMAAVRILNGRRS